MITVRFGDERELKLNYSAGYRSIYEFLTAEGIRDIHAFCGGNGSCKKCQVFVEGLGNVLACQTNLQDGMTIGIDSESAMQILESDSISVSSDGEKGLGVACDLGTTTVVARLIDLSTGEILDSISQKNSQRVWGADVISRIAACQRGKLEELQRTVVEQIRQMIIAMLSKAVYTNNLSQMQLIERTGIKRIVIAGNTVMEHILMGFSPETIGVSPFRPLSYFGETTEDNLFFRGSKIELYISPAVAGFVGGDITADLLSIDKVSEDNTDKDFVLLDIGTNGEIVLKSGNNYICCAVAAGPAFEGAQIEMGMDAITGAISKVSLDSSTGDIIYEVIGGGRALGICGSGLIDAIALLIKLGVIDETGYMAEPRFYITDEVYISQDDIRAVQMAKAAMAAGLEVMLQKSGLEMSDIGCLYIAGGFGSFMDVDNAIDVGLIPKEMKERVVILGNASLSGAEVLLLSKASRDRLVGLSDEINYIELSDDESFTDLYIKKMYF